MTSKPINLRATASMTLRNEGLFTEEIASFWQIIEKNFAGHDPVQIVSNFVTTFRIRLHNAERRSFHRGMENYQLTLGFILRLYILQKGLCYYNQRIILQPNRTIGRGGNHVVSIERLVQEQDYTVANTVLCAIQYNVVTQMCDDVFQKLVKGETLPQPVPRLLFNDANFMESVRPFFQKFINKRNTKESYEKRYLKQVAEEESFSLIKFQEKKRKFAEEHGISEKIDNDDNDDNDDSTNDEEEKDNQKDTLTNRIIRKFLPQVLITIEHLYQLYDKQHGRCGYSQHPLILASGSPFSCSVERIDNLKHYEEGNCLLVCFCMQAGRAKWTRESFISDHSYWLQNFDALLLAQRDISTLRLQFIAHYPPKESPITAQSLPRIVHAKNDGTNTCQFCNDGQSFSRFKSLTQHKIDLHPETLFACPHPSCRTGWSSDSQHRIFLEPWLLVSHYISKHSEKSADGRSICNFERCNTLLGAGSTVSRHVAKQHENQIYNIAAELYNKHNASFVYLRPMRINASRFEERQENKKRTLGID